MREVENCLRHSRRTDRSLARTYARCRGDDFHRHQSHLPSEPSKVCRKVIPQLSRGKGGGGYRAGGSLTKQTGSIPDTVQRAQRHIEGRHPVESEQCTRTHLEGLTQPLLSASY